LPEARNLTGFCFCAALFVLAPTGVFAIGTLPDNKASAPPDNVKEAVDAAAQSCRDFGGEPETDAVLSFSDVNGDGGEDWIADYSKLKCQGALNPMCDEDGCDVQIYLWDGAMSWPLAFEENLLRFNFAKSGRKRVLKATLPGRTCERPSNQTCTELLPLEPKSSTPPDE
jgi:hypothetical protein